MAHGYFENTACAEYQPPDCEESWNQPLIGRDVREDSTSWAQAAGGAISSARDVDTWMRAIFGGQVVPPEQQAEWLQMVSSKTGEPIADVTPEDPQGFALGLVKATGRPVGRVWFYQGTTLGYRTLYVWFEDDDILVTVQQPARHRADRHRLGRRRAGDWLCLRRATKSRGHHAGDAGVLGRLRADQAPPAAGRRASAAPGGEPWPTARGGRRDRASPPARRPPLPAARARRPGATSRSTRPSRGPCAARSRWSPPSRSPRPRSLSRAGRAAVGDPRSGPEPPLVPSPAASRSLGGPHAPRRRPPLAASPAALAPPASAPVAALAARVAPAATPAGPPRRP